MQALGTCVKKSGANKVEKLRIDENITVMQVSSCTGIITGSVPL